MHHRLRLPRPLTRRAAVLCLAAALAAGSLVPSVTASAAAAEPDEGSPAPVMPEFSAESFELEASALPAALAEAIERDLGDDAAEYLARSAASSAAADVLEGLAGEGIDTSEGRLQGTELVVPVHSQADADAVEAAGATADFGDTSAGPTPAPDYSAVRLDALADLEGGQPFVYSTQVGNTRTIYACSIAFNGRSSGGAAQFLTAGHCLVPNRTDGGVVFGANQSAAGSNPVRGFAIGTPIESTFQFGSGADSGLVSTASGWNPLPAVATWGGGRGAIGDGQPVVIRDLTTAVAGAPICKSGRQTGWTCGEILVANQPAQVYNQQGAPVIVNSILTSACMLPGDSGSAAVVGSAALGVGSSGSFAGDCADRGPGEISAFFPLRTTDGSASVATTSPAWEPLVSLADPTVTVPVFVGDSIRGSLVGGGPRHRVTVKIGTSATLVATPASDGTWSVPVPASLSTGRHDFTVQASWGRTAVSALISRSYELAARPAVDRIGGPDRFAVAAAVAQRAYPAKAPVVVIATGADYPDALSAAPAAVALQGPLLLTQRDSLPDATVAQLRRLAPSRILVVGGAATIGESVMTQLAAYAGTVTRVAGADRYETSRKVADAALDSAPTAYVATGQNYPDALSASAAAGSRGGPVLLVDGRAADVDAASLAVLDALKIGPVTIAGGEAAVSSGIASRLSTRGTVVRQSGADRFATSVNLNKAAFTASPTVYLATGYNYPDALAGGVLAGQTDAPLFVVPTTCVPGDVLAQIKALKATKVVLFGGTAALSDSVAKLVPCL